MRKVLRFLKTYLVDWRNLLAHSLVGVGILCVAFLMPIKPMYRIIALIAIIGFNIIRMRLKGKKRIQNSEFRIQESEVRR